VYNERGKGIYQSFVAYRKNRTVEVLNLFQLVAVQGCSGRAVVAAVLNREVGGLLMVDLQIRDCY
jgi:hypothetical protein